MVVEATTMVPLFRAYNATIIVAGFMILRMTMGTKKMESNAYAFESQVKNSRAS